MSKPSRSKRWIGGIGLVVVMLFLLETFPMTIWPELFTWGYLISNGYRVYDGIYSIYPPLLSSLIQMLVPLGWGIAGYQLLSYAAFLTPPLVVWHYLSKRISIIDALGWTVAVILWQLRFEGSGIWFDHLLGVWGVLACVSWLNADHRKTSFWLGLALLSKQTAVYAIAVFVLDQLKTGSHPKRWLVPMVITVLLGVGLLIPTDLLLRAYHLTVEVGVGYLPRQADQVQWPNLAQWVLMALWVVPLGVLAWVRRVRFSLDEWLLLGLWLSLAMGTVTRFELFHLVPSIAALALTLVTLSSKSPRLQRTLMLSWLVPALIVTLEYSLDAFGSADRFVSAEAFEVASLIREYPVDDGVYVLGSYDHWYPLTGTMPSTQQLFFQVPMFWKRSDLVESTVRELMANPPRVIVRGKESYIAPELGKILPSYQKVAEIPYSQGDLEIWLHSP